MHATTLHFGHLYVPFFSIFLAIGLILALLLTQRTAPLAGVPKQAMWDATIFTAISAFAISRLLLIAFHLKSFLTYPILLLTLPSLTVSGLGLTVIAVVIYLHRRRLSIAAVLDAAAPPLALLWAILSLGAFATGSNGLPTTVPWAVQDAMLGPIHPVEMYTALAAFALCGGLYRALAKQQTPGQTAATGLFLAGAAAFLLDFLTIPANPDRIVLLDPVQWLGLAMLLAGFFVLLPRLAAPIQST